MTSISEVDAFDLPEWLGESEVTWRCSESLRLGARVRGTLTSDGHAMGCDLLAVDCAFPVVVLPGEWRTITHRLWRHGQIALLDLDGALCLGVPSNTFTADLALDAIGRLARSVGVRPDHFVVALRPS